jgi:hypothetical protein
MSTTDQEYNVAVSVDEDQAKDILNPLVDVLGEMVVQLKETNRVLSCIGATLDNIEGNLRK